MHVEIFDELLSYATSLVVMQRLEGRHSILKRLLAFKFHQTPAALSAAMRRRQNLDLQAPQFQRRLADFLARIGELFSGSWESKTGLLESFMKDMSAADHSQLAELRAAKQEFTAQLASVCLGQHEQEQPNDMNLLREHVKLALVKGKCYALKGCLQKDSWTVFRMIHPAPSNNMYLQRACHISFDEPCVHHEYNFEKRLLFFEEQGSMKLPTPQLKVFPFRASICL